MIPVNSTDSYDGHYWAGVQYTGGSSSATEVQVELNVPGDAQPQSGDFYYVLVSVFDNAGSYDQVGLVNDYGWWSVAYSTTSPITSSTGCGTQPTYHSVAGAAGLGAGQEYYFAMTLSSGYVQFSVTAANSGSSVFSKSAYTGGSSFDIGGNYDCGSYWWYDYTNYEEVYYTAAPVPPYDFFFTNNSVNSFGKVGTWGLTTLGSSPPSAVNVYINGGSSSNSCGGSVPGYCPITIANEPYFMYASDGQSSATVEPTSVPQTYSLSVTVSEVSSDSPISLATYSVPGGWTVTLLTSQGSPPFSSGILFSLPSTASAGAYYLGIVASDGSGASSRITFHVNVLPMLTVSPSGSPSSGDIDVGQTTVVAANAGGGSGSYSLDWIDAPFGCDAGTSASFQCQPSSSGTFPITVSVTDSLDYTAVGTTTYTVDSDPVVTLSLSSGSVSQSQSVTLVASVLGGAGGFTYSWNGLPSGCAGASSANLACSPTASGTYVITVTATDQNGGQSTGSANLTVNWALLGQSASTWSWIVVLVILIGVVLTVVVLASRRKKRDDPGNPSIGQRAQLYSPQTGPSPVQDLTPGPAEVWAVPSRGDPPLDPPQGTASPNPTPAAEGEVAYWHTPLLNPPETTCWHCKSENPPASLYCSRCGLPLEPPPPPMAKEIASNDTRA